VSAPASRANRRSRRSVRCRGRAAKRWCGACRRPGPIEEPIGQFVSRHRAVVGDDQPLQWVEFPALGFQFCRSDRERGPLRAVPDYRLNGWLRDNPLALSGPPRSI
jgi:hypothetical protein